MIKNILTIISAVALLVSVTIIQSHAAQQPTTLAEQQTWQSASPAKANKSAKRPTGEVFKREKGIKGEHKYIVRFDDKPLATYRGTIPGLNATAVNAQHSPGKRRAAKLNPRNADSQAYLAYLDQRQQKMEQAMSARLGRTINVLRRYRAAINGFALRITQDEAGRLASVPGVVRIERDREAFPTTDQGPSYIGAEDIWSGIGTGMEAQGEGIVFGILDSGINGDHPSFAEVGGDGYVHVNPLGSGVFLGECDPASPDYKPEVECNDKLIGRYLFIDATPTEDNSEDTDGHGSHVASTAGGNFIEAPVFDAEGNPTGLDLSISGVAPHANIVAFQVCAPGCFDSDRIAAVDQAILDGVVDVINHSIGSNTPVTINPWTDSAELAFLAARAAGITIANSVGNNGPEAATLGGANAPWTSNSGAFTHDRDIPGKLLSDFSGGDTAVPAAIEGRGVTAGYGPANIVYAGDFSNGDPDPEQCLTPFPAGTWTNGEIVVCDRGAIARVDKCIHVRDGGAAGCVLANVDGGSTSIANDAHVIPAIHINAASGNTLKAWLASGSGHTAVIGDGLLPWGVDPALGGIAADFTSRGPHLGQDYLPVSVGSPGVDIYAAYVNGVEYSFLSGTSMASPHTAGASGLLKQVKPDWTDAEILSALATTANTLAFKEDGVTPADPFDVGGGMLRVDLAAQAGLLLDETVANFEAANPDLGGDPKNLNVAGLVNRECLINCSWTRTVEATTDSTWTVVTTDPAISVSPASFTLLAGATQSLVISVNSADFPVGEWVHGRVDMIPTGDLPAQHLTVSFVPSVGQAPAAASFEATRDADSYLVEGIESIEITDLQVAVAGLVAPTVTNLSLAGDSDNSTPYDDLTDGVAFSLINAPAGASRLLAFTTDAESESPDVGLFVGLDANGNGLPEASEQVCVSASATASEVCDLGDLAAGTWWVLVQNWQASATPPDDIVLNTALVTSDVGNLAVDAPLSVPQLTPFDIRLIWDLPGSVEGDTFYGTVTLGSDAANPDNIGVLPVTIVRGADDVNYSASSPMASVGDTLTFSVEVAPNFSPEDRSYEINTVIPESFSLVDGSVTGGGVITGNAISWPVTQVSLADAQPGYDVITSNEDPACAVPFATNGGYTDLEQLGIFPDVGVTGDTVTYSAFSGQNFNFFGESFVGGFNFTDDGFAFFDGSTPGSTPWVNLPIPDSADPNSLIATLWRDMIVPPPSTTPGAVVGVSLAVAGPDFTLIEYDNMELYPGGGGDSIDFELGISGLVDDSPGAYEIVMAFDNVNVSDSTGTIGIEDAAGAAGTQYAFNDIAVTNGMAICYDLVGTSSDPVVLTYQVVVDAAAAGSTVVSELSHSVDSVGSQTVVLSQAVEVVGEPLPDYTTQFIGPLADLEPVEIGEIVRIRMRLFESGEQTVEPTVNFEIVDSAGITLRSLTSRVLPGAGGIYARNARLRGPRFPAGSYTINAVIDGEVVGSLPLILIEPM